MPGRSPDNAEFLTVYVNGGNVLYRSKIEPESLCLRRLRQRERLAIQNCPGVVLDPTFRPGRPIVQRVEFNRRRAAPGGIEREMPGLG